MKALSAAVAVLGVVLLVLAGCGLGEKDDTKKANGNKELAQRKERTVKSLEERLAELEKKLEELKTGAEAQGEESKAEFERRKAELDVTIEQVRDMLAEAADVGADGWADFETGLLASVDELEEACDEAAADFE